MDPCTRTTKSILAAFVIGLYSLAIAASANATTYYLSPSPNASDSNNGTSPSPCGAGCGPWLTVQHAFSSVQAGDAVQFRAGVYGATGTVTGTLQISGSSNSNRIVFTNYPGEVAVIQGTIDVGFYSHSCTSTSTCVAYVTFQGTPSIGAGLIFEGPVYPGDGVVEVMGAHDVTFDHVEIRNAHQHAGFYEYSSYNIQLTASYIHDNGTSGQVNVDNGIYWDTTNGGGNLIANNVIEHNVGPGLSLYLNPSNVTVEENTIVNNGNYGIAMWGSSNAIVNNVLLNNGETTGNQQMKVGVATSGANFTIDTNILECTSPQCHSGIYYANNDPVDVNTIESDPQFVDAADHNYRLLCGSPAFTTQKSGYAQTVDKDGVTRSAQALGAYVY